MAKIDRRISRSKRSIRAAFKELVQEQEYDCITITELARRADIDRKTFYSHYSTISDLLQEIEDELAGRLRHLIQSEPSPGCDAFLAMLNDILIEDIDFYRRISISNSYSFMKNTAKEVLKSAIAITISGTSMTSESLISIRAEFIASGIIGVYADWFNRDCAESLDELSDSLRQVIRAAWD